MNRAGTVEFSEDDLKLFSRASGDQNPLHLSTPYASRTVYGERVVFGALGCLACLGRVEQESGSIKRITADFQRPMFVGVRYRLDSKQSRDAETVRLFDGSAPVLTVSVQFSPADEAPCEWEGEAVFPHSEARQLRLEDLSVGLRMEGSYQTDLVALEQLCRRWSVKVALPVLEAVLWSSYFVGMEMPGRNALFFRAAMDFGTAARAAGAIWFSSTVATINVALAQVKISFELGSGRHVIASGQLTAFVRPEVKALDWANEYSGSSAGEPLAGKVAVVVGASRGLGAALAFALAVDGAKVIAISRSELSWIADVPEPVQSRLVAKMSDAGEVDQLAALEVELAAEYGGIDFLICSAFPPIPSLRLEADAASRIKSYLARATDLVLNPLCIFLPALQRSKGCVVLISSGAVDKPVRDWPHYVAAKNAAEALCAVGPMQYAETSALIVRPERLETEMTNTPMGRKGALKPSVLAREICARLRSTPRAGVCELYAAGGWAERTKVMEQVS